MTFSGAKLHIVSFDVPYPANYGGAIDVFYKIKSLHEAGCEIYLHCFEYGSGRAEILKEYCKEVWYYSRRTGVSGLSLTLPYIVYSRRSDELLERLIAIDAPILFEGVHSSYYMEHLALKGRRKMIRTHNIEHQYYRHLYRKESSILSKLFFAAEARLLKKYETRLNAVDAFFELSLSDEAYFKRIYPSKLHEFVAPFHPFTADDIPTGHGQFCLYHGNLSHPENIETVIFLLEQVIPEIEYPFVIAGRKPTHEIVEHCRRHKHCTLHADPDDDKMHALIRDAHIHVIPTFQRSGMKLKLLYALFGGRHVIANDNILHGTGLDETCYKAESPGDFIQGINELMNIDFDSERRSKRSVALAVHYNNSANAERIMTYLQQ